MHIDLDGLMQMHVDICNCMNREIRHGHAAKTDQPQALSLCAARGDRADREGGGVRAGRYRSCQQAGLVFGDFAARQDAVLQVGVSAIFESAVILEYLEETEAKPLHPADPLRRAEHRGWIEFGSSVLNDIAGFYAAKDEATFKAKASQVETRFARLEARVAAAPWFDGESFSLVDAVFAPVFRYFDVFDEIGDFGILADKPKLARWRKSLAARPSVRSAVSADYPALLRDFIDRRNSWLSGLQARAAA
jgi:glutathione S-transferase